MTDASSNSSSRGQSAARRCLVTGATGFIGSCLARVLAQRGWQVTALVRAASDCSVLRGVPIRRAAGDLMRPQSLGAAIARQDVVFHCAGLTKAIEPRDLVRVNGVGTRNLLDACARADPPPERIVVLSSQAAAGPALADGSPRTESDTPRPVSLYGRSKRLGEVECERAARQGLPVVVLRPVAVYGPRDRDFLLIFRSVERFGCLIEAGEGPIEFQAMHVIDLVRAMTCAAEAECGRVAGRTFFVGHPRPWSSEGFAWEIARALGIEHLRTIRIPMHLAWVAAGASEFVARLRGKPGIFSRDKLREIERSPWICSVEQFEAATGFRARIDVPKGVDHTARWYLRRGWM